MKNGPTAACIAGQYVDGTLASVLFVASKRSLAAGVTWVSKMSLSRIFEYLEKLPHFFEVRFGFLDRYFRPCAFIGQLFKGLPLPTAKQLTVPR